MADSSIPQLTVAIGLTGAEWLEIAQLQGVAPNQSYASRRCTAAQIALLAANIVPIGPTGVAADSPAGVVNNYTVNGEFGPLTGLIVVTPAAACTCTGLQAGFDGQLVIFLNLSGNMFTLEPLNAGSLAANQFMLAGNLQLPQNNSQAFKYFAALGKWVKL